MLIEWLIDIDIPPCGASVVVTGVATGAGASSDASEVSSAFNCLVRM
jgi:hypothetical protein